MRKVFSKPTCAHCERHVWIPKNVLIKLNFFRKPKRSQVWIETVIYTLIGLAIIGILLAVAKPKIDEMRDKMVIEQTIESMNKIDSKIYETQGAPGNKRVLDVKISKGRLVIDASNDKLLWILESAYQYSEQDTSINLGNLNVLTKLGNPWTIELSIDYAVDLTYSGGNNPKELEAAPSPYSISVENLGVKDGKIQIDLDILS